MSKRALAAILLTLSIAASLFANPARPGWTKIELIAPDGGGVPAELLAHFGADLVADYGSYSIIYAPAGVAEALKAAAGEKKIRVRVRDDLDRLLLPGAAVDARQGIHGVAPQKLFSEYPAGKPGIFVVQLIAPARKEWVDGLQALGWRLAQYVPNDGYLLVGPPELAAKTRQLPYVQWLDFYHPYQKAAFLSGDAAAHDLLFQLPAGADSQEGVEAIRAAAGKIDVQHDSLDTIVTARMTDAAAAALLRHPMILAVNVKYEATLADGRQAQSLSPLLNTSQTQPSTNGDYWNWVLGHCPECANMTAGNWRIGIADSGLDNGAGQFGHPDLDGRKYFGIIGYDPTNPNTPDDVCPQNQPLCDRCRHGTLVSGVAAGNAATGVRDSAGFLAGLGGAPYAGIFMTKITTGKTCTADPTLLFNWTKNAADNGVTIQNHSYQTYTGGSYDSYSRQYDKAVLDADDTLSPARPQILLTIPSGNRIPQSNDYTSSFGMAKNVLTVGGLENYRPDADSLSCSRSAADSFKNIMSFSKTGNTIPGYFKPDLMAPASSIVSTETSMIQPDDAYCLKNYIGDGRYSGDTGTSFAAPLGAGAAMVVKRYLGNAPGDTSPALIKAALIAGAHSVRGGEDRTKNPVMAIGAAPNQQQGFGRLTLEDILNGSQKPVFFDQSPSRTFIAAGQTFCTRLQVRDATKPVKVALVWSDAPAADGASPALVNDLNLEVRRASNPSSVYVGNSLAVTNETNGEESIAYAPGATLPLDAINNVEYFRSFMNANEQFSITVKAWNIVGDTDGNTATNEQNFALVILNADLISTGTCDTPPSAVFTLACADLTCTANASASSDDFGITNYAWNWGDGNTTNTSTAITTHTYAAAGTFSVTLTTTDTAGQNSTPTSHTAAACNPPGISTQPASQTITPSSTATLSVTASGSGPFSYQWYEGTSGTTTTPVGTNSASFTTPALTATKSYWVRVTSTCNATRTVDSGTATVTVQCTAGPVITTQPTSRTITSGQPTTLSVTATQAATCQWYVGTAPSTANPITPSDCSITVAPSVTTNYWVRVLNGCGQADSNTITVTTCDPVGITTQPASQTITAGSTATLSVVASGSGPFSYQWYDGASGTTTTPVGTNSSSFTTPALTANKQYWVRVSSSCNGGSANSATATITVLCTVPPSITAQPTSRTINSGQTTTLTVTASSAGTTTYQWYQGVAPSTTTPVGTNSSSFTAAPTTSTSYWVRVSNGCGSVNSVTATVTVCAPPTIATQPASTTITSGQTATLTVAAGGSGPFIYQWYEGASGVTTTPVGTNSSSFTTPALTATKSYWVRVTSTCNGSASVNSNAATVTVVPPQIARRQTAAATAWSQQSITATWPQPTQAGNLLVAVLSGVTEPTFNWNTPAGWVLAQSYEWNDIKTSIYYIANNAGGRTSETFTVSSGFHDQTLDILEYSGVALTNALDKTAFNGNFSNTGYIDTGYTAQASQLKEVAIGVLTTFTPTTISNPSDGFIELDDQSIGWNLTTAVLERNTTAAGHMGVSCAVGGGQQWLGVVATFRSANPN